MSGLKVAQTQTNSCFGNAQAVGYNFWGVAWRWEFMSADR